MRLFAVWADSFFSQQEIEKDYQMNGGVDRMTPERW